MRGVGLAGRHRGRLPRDAARFVEGRHLRTFANCITAVRAYLDHHRFVGAYRSPFDEAPRTPSPSFRKTQALMRPGQQLSEHAAKQLLRAYGIRVPREQLVTSAAAAAVRAASLVGYPVVMKASGAQIAHKTELGLVKIGLTSASQVRDAASSPTSRATRGSRWTGCWCARWSSGAWKWSWVWRTATSSGRP